MLRMSWMVKYPGPRLCCLFSEGEVSVARSYGFF